ncbi:ATP-binding protein [Comamonadaceae bacterium G21597-S1]|nr:ATP-binding protein [Comamonadaceae bacterium G21597-S1]
MMQPDSLFLDEAFASLDAMDLDVGRFDVDPDAVNAVFRRAHSVKGGAAAFGLEAVAELMHQVESVLDGIRKSGVAPDSATSDLLREAVGAAREMLAGGSPLQDPRVQALMQRLRRQQDDAGALRGGRVRRIVIRSPETEVVFAAVTGLFADIAGLGELLSVENANADEQVFTVRTAAGDDELRDLLAMHMDLRCVTIGGSTGLPVRARATMASPAAEPRDMPADTRATVRVDASELRRLVLLARDLAQDIASHAEGARGRDGSEADQNGKAGVGHWRSAAGSLHQGLESLASAPMSMVFEHVTAQIRRLSERLGKQFTLEARGDEVRIDRLVLQRLSDPLMHLVRNACDHGIERSDQRLALGKPVQGRIAISAWIEDGWLRIAVRDDGQGLSREQVMLAARQRGVPVAADMDDDQVWPLVFAPGLTTAAGVSDVSGRGVGMDAVRRQVVALGGDVTIASVAGQGACVTMAIPLGSVCPSQSVA